jgi:hypothetical protein
MGGSLHAAGPRPQAEPAPVTVADVKSMLGTWELPLETPTGPLLAKLEFRVEAGKVVVGVSAPQLAERKITDITKSGEVLTLKASMNYTGALAAYAGPVAMVMMLTPKGSDYAVWIDFNDAGFQIGGTATKKS